MELDENKPWGLNLYIHVKQQIFLKAAFLYSIYHQRAGETRLFHMRGFDFTHFNTCFTFKKRIKEYFPQWEKTLPMPPVGQLVSSGQLRSGPVSVRAAPVTT